MLIIFQGKVVTIKIKTVAFNVMTRAHTIREYTQDTEQIYLAAAELLKKEISVCSPELLRLRLMGKYICISNYYSI